MKKIMCLLCAYALISAGILSGCSSALKGQKSVIRIGYVNPTTGALAGNGEGCSWVVDQISAYLKEHPIEVSGKEMEMEIIVYDSASDQNTCSEMAQKLIEEDQIDLMIAIQTPNTVIPVVQVAERFGVPCIAIVGGMGDKAEEMLSLVDSIVPTVQGPCTLEYAMEHAEALYASAASRVIRILAISNAHRK